MVDATAVLVATFTFLLILIILLARMICIIAPYEVGLLTLLGSYRRQLNPGFHLIHPFGRVLHVDLRTRALPIPARRIPVIGGTVAVGGEASFRIMDAPRAVFQTQNLNGSVQEAIGVAIIDSLTGQDLAHLGAAGFALNPLAREALDQAVARFGAEIESIALRLES